MANRRTGPRRASAAAMVLAVIAAVATPGITLSVGQAPGAVCVGGWAVTNSPALGGATAVDVTYLADSPWIAGSENREGSRPSAFTAIGAEEGWTPVALAPTPNASLLTAISGAGANELWAAGAAVGSKTQPLIQHWSGGSWVRAKVPDLRFGGALTDIASLGPTTALAVGYSASLKGQHPLAYRWLNGAWGVAAPRLNDFGSLSAVAAVPDGSAWAVGWVQTRAGLRPLLQQWNGTAWRRATIRGTGPAVLTGVVAASPTDAWAVGYRQRSTGLSALVIHWNGTRWSVVNAPPVPAAGGAILRDVTLSGGDVVAVGLGWNSSSKDSLPLIATLRGGTWDVALGVGGVTSGDLIAVAAGPQLVAVGRVGSRAMAMTPCEPGHAPAPTGSTAWSAPAGTGVGGGVAARPGAPGDADGAAARPGRVGRSTTAVPPPISVPSLEIRDLSVQSGLSRTTLTYSGSASDLDGDGWTDLVIGRHARSLLVLRNVGGVFQQPFAGGYEQADRHGCSVGDIDRDGLPEIACAVGANHGLGIKANEVWLSPIDPVGTNQAALLGVDDPVGRGRRTAIFDANHDGLPDLYVANDPNRADGLPSSNRLFVNVDGVGFRPSPAAGLDVSIGGNCLAPADLDRDGWTDLIVCEAVPMARYVGLRVFHNNNGRFIEVSDQLGLTSRGDIDAKVGDLDGDGAPDIVRIGTGRLEVDLQRKGVFAQALGLAVSYAQAVTLADVNGDGRQDIYVVRGTRNVAIQDLLLLNDGTGRSFTSVALPSIQPGLGGSAIAIDYDHNGRDDLVVLHGNNLEEGPVQLLAFGPPWPGEPAPTPAPEPTPTLPPRPVPTPDPGTPTPEPAPETAAPETPPADTPLPTPELATPAPTDGIAGVPVSNAGSGTRPPALASVGGAITLGALGLAALFLFGFHARRRNDRV
jgi:hypothetical protein